MDQSVLHGEIVGLTASHQTNTKTLKYREINNTSSSAADYEDMESMDPYIVQPRMRATHEELGLVYIQENSTAQDDSNQALTHDSIKMEQYVNLEVLLAPVHNYQQYLVSDELFTPTFGTTEETNTSNIIHQTIELDIVNPFNFTVEQGGIKSEVDDGNNIGVNAKSNRNSNNNNNNNNTVLTDLSNDNNSVVVSNNSEMLPADDIGGNFSSELADVDIDLSEYDFMSDWRESLNQLCYYNDNNSTTRLDEEPTVTKQPDIAIKTQQQPTVIKEIKFPLKLDIRRTIQADIIDIQTPDIINTICSFETEYETHEVITGEIINPHEILKTPYQTPVPSPSSSTNQASESSSHKPIRKRKRTEDDEDYVPPNSTKQYRWASSDSDDSDETVVRRGRPIKRFSVSSEGSEPVRYREMRDKNNEASRKSRQKRKVQEFECELERRKLESRNIKLKAQVIELERVVGRYRKNMMAVMLQK